MISSGRNRPRSGCGGQVPPTPRVLNLALTPGLLLPREIAPASTLHWFQMEVLAEERNYQGLVRLCGGAARRLGWTGPLGSSTVRGEADT